MRLVPMRRLLEGAPEGYVPLRVTVTQDPIHHDEDMFTCHVSNVTDPHHLWKVTHSSHEFEALKDDIVDHATCQNSSCSGSCEAIRDYLTTCFPKKRFLGIRHRHRLEERKQRYESMLMHLLRCVLLPGSAMRCYTSRKSLPPKLYQFLQVDDAKDRRSLLQIFVDNHQQNTSSQSSSTSSDLDGYDNSNCTICMDSLQQGHSQDEGTFEDESETATVSFPCGHLFHRECIFEWLLFQFHCPLCRSRVGPKAVKSYCCAKRSIQWWLGDFEHDPLEEVALVKTCV
uniref:Uncharacterized protein AlNc14C79G5236 n=1 Tax=Albugo laibachii Nc14 TaxID=890382 RepID=F0WF42_9STRA|nr:conserved hypothetical protein [Albugo laibachii Nc14]|eukprot:CCA19824.1 conserved hypothetical protein [Albugo laibachii Nc14]